MSADRQARDGRLPVGHDLRLVLALAGRQRHRQLQHGRALSFDKLGHQHVFAVGEFDRVMMAVGNVRIDLAELADTGIDRACPDPAIIVADVVGEGELRSRQQAETATVGSAADAKPRVEVPRKVVVTTVSPTSAGRDAMACRL
ncbi:hypothetical protein ACVW1A_007088 [Bradyrhizobium sp. LB1.3]